jgi:CubicO group peptidase (beta-lactamase class C family)
MQPPTDALGIISRRRFLHAAVAGLLTAAVAPARRSPVRAAAAAAAAPTAEPDFRELDDVIRAGMAQYGIPGVAVGVLAQGTEYVQGYGVTTVDYPVPVDGDTLFRIASTTKTVTGTTVMRLVEQGTLALDAPVRTYLPDFQTSDPSVASRVTLRQLLNHSPGWLGDYYEDMGPGDDALARYMAGMVRLPQLTPLGTVFHYNNAALSLAGHVIEAATGSPYERVVRELLLEPLGLAHSRFFSDEIVGFNVAASHNLVDGQSVVAPAFWYVPRSIHPTGGLISSARDQLRYARFHLGDGTAPDGTRLLSQASLVAMRSNPGPGGTLAVELDGLGVTWWLRPRRRGRAHRPARRGRGGPALGLHHGPRPRLRPHRTYQLRGRAQARKRPRRRRLGAAAVRRRQQPAGRAARPQPRRAGPVRGPLRESGDQRRRGGGGDGDRAPGRPGPPARDVDAPAPAPRPLADRPRAHRPGVSPGLLSRRVRAPARRHRAARRPPGGLRACGRRPRGVAAPRRTTAPARGVGDPESRGPSRPRGEGHGCRHGWPWVVYPQTFYTDLNKLRLLAAFGETGWFGGLAPVSGPEEGRKSRVVPEGRSLHFPRCRSRALHFTKNDADPRFHENVRALKPTLSENAPTLTKNRLKTSGWTHVT